MFISFGEFDFKTSRDLKGKSLIAFPNSFTVIDLETTGLSPAWDSIIEVAAVKVRNNKIIDQFSSLVNTSSGIRLDKSITERTGITQEMVNNAPLINSILPKYLTFLEADILIGHNVNFDINFLYDNSMEYMGIPLTNNFVDTLRLSRRIHPEFSHHRLSDLAERYEIDYSGAHRALIDCRITFECFNKIQKDILDKFSSLDEFTSSITRASHSRVLNKVRAKDITASQKSFDFSHPFYNKTCVFTGVLERMKRKDAMQLVADVGGINSDSVTRKTNFLILGNNDYCASLKDGKSNKHKKAEKLKSEGYDIEIIPENVFYDIISDSFTPVSVIDSMPEDELLVITPQLENLFIKIQELLDSLITECELPRHSLHLFSNISQKGTNKGKEISKSICIYEPEYPMVKEDVNNPGKNFTVMNIKGHENAELLIRNGQFDNIPLPDSAEVKELKSDHNFKHVLFGTDDGSVIPYIKENILYCLRNYHSKAKSFGCCSRFIECSDAKRCVHVNKLYSTSCTYRRNLEAGNIFYGKNKNV